MRLEDVRLALFFKDFAAWIRTSCVGLNVAGFTTAKVLQDHGIDVVVYPVRHNIDIVESIEKYNKEHEEPLNHVVISAPWLSPYDLECMLKHFRHIRFVILSHSNVGFLQADPDGLKLLRCYYALAATYENLQIGGNSPRFVNWMRHAYDKDAILLPNLYPIGDDIVQKQYTGGLLKIGAFGAVRPEKNFMTAAAAACAISKSLNQPVEFHMSTGGEGDLGRTAPAIDQMCHGTKVTVIRHPWNYWDKFIELVAQMDLLIQMSYTESFNMVTADGISVGVPSVVSPAIYWAPDDWKADPDDAMDVAIVGLNLLLRKRNRNDGVIALRKHNQKGWHYWKLFLEENPECFSWFSEMWRAGIRYIFATSGEPVEFDWDDKD